MKQTPNDDEDTILGKLLNAIQNKSSEEKVTKKNAGKLPEAPKEFLDGVGINLYEICQVMASSS